MNGPLLAASYVDEDQSWPLVAEFVAFSNELNAPTRIKRTNANVQLVPRSYHDWLKNRCVNTVRLYASNLIEGARKAILKDGSSEKALLEIEERKGGNETTCSHYIETADLAVNFGSYLLKKIPLEVIAFTAYAHDLVEDFKKFDPSLSNEGIVKECWVKQGGDPAWANFITESLDLLTDNPNLHGQERLDDQIRIANTKNPDGSTPLIIQLVSLVRYCDKLATLNRDYANLLQGIMPFGSQSSFVCYYKKREKLVMRLDNVSDRLKRWYKRLIKNKVEPAFAAFVPAKIGPDGKPIPHEGLHTNNNFLDPINFVMRSSHEHDHVTRQKLARPSFPSLAPTAATL